MKVAIIGSGIGGLGAAALLASRGYEVTVYEKNDVLGGRAAVYEAEGFTFDMGPSWYLMPDVFKQFFDLLDEDVDELLDLVRLDPSYRVFFEGTPEPVDIPADTKELAHIFEQFEAGAGAKLSKYLARVKAQYEVITTHYLWKNLQSPLTLVGRGAGKALIHVPLFGSVDSYVKRTFSSPKIRQLLEYTLVFLGASPYNAPAMYAMMAHVDYGLGVFYPQGGMYTLIEALVSIGKKHGVTFKLNTPITAIITQKGRATAIRLEDGSEPQYDIVISNADMEHTETVLLEESARSYPKTYWDRRTLGPSALLMYLGVKGDIEQFKHHTLYFSEDWSTHFKSIYESKDLPENPCFYLCAPSKTDPSVAPKGFENVFVLIPLPATHFNDSEMHTYAESIIDHISTVTGVKDFRERITYRRDFYPSEFITRYNSQSATALGLAHTLTQTAFLRPSGKSRKLKNLYYVGAGVHPGVGMPVCLISSHISAQQIFKDFPLAT